MGPKETERDDLRDLLRGARGRLKITQEEAALRAGVTLRTYARWERGKNVPQGQNLLHLANGLGLDSAELARAASRDGVPVAVRAEQAEERAIAAEGELVALREQVADLGDEVRRLAGLVRAYQAPVVLAEDGDGLVVGVRAADGRRVLLTGNVAPPDIAENSDRRLSELLDDAETATDSGVGAVAGKGA